MIEPARELRYALRSLRRNLRLTVVAALTLALGIGASTAILSVTKGVLLDPLPYPDPDRLALIWSELPRSGYLRAPLSGPEVDDLRRRSRHFAELASIWSTTAALVEENEPETLRLALVTWNFLSMLGAEPLVGRSFAPGDEGFGVAPVVMLSEGMWRRRYAGDPGVIGRSLRLDGGWGFPGGVYTVVGVVPDEFRLELPADAGVATGIDAWTPLPFDLAALPRGNFYLRTLGRLAAGATLPLARTEIRELGAELEAEFPVYAATGRAFDAVPLKGDVVGPARPVVTALLIGVGFLLLVACANVAGLLLARAAGRQQEVLLRTALGASGSQIARQLLAESLLLALLGGAGGVALGAWGVRLLRQLTPASLPRAESLAVDPLVLGVALGVSLLCGLLFGMAPVLWSQRLELHAGLRSGMRGAGGVGAPGLRGRDLLVVAELAAACVLLFGAALCWRTVERLEQVDLGFEPERRLSFELTLPRGRYGSAAELGQFTVELERRLGGIPGVEGVGAINQLPLSALPNWSSPYRLRGRDEGEAREADARVVSAGFFDSVSARRVAGRWFDERDDESGRPVVVVDELLAARAWPDGAVVGQEIEIQVATERGFVPVWAEVVGVVGHLRLHDPRHEVREQLYVPFSQGARNQMAVVVHGGDDPRRLLAPIREQLSALDGDLAIAEVRPLVRYVEDARQMQELTMVLAALFASIALALGSVGLYGVIAYAVSCQRREIGLRMALGSTGVAIAGRVLARGFKLGLAGIGLGIVGALVVGRLLAGLLFGVAPSDPLSLGLVPVLLGLVALAAGWIPARRATRVDPATVLRGD